MKKHHNKIIYNQKNKYNYMKSTIINNNETSFREDHSQKKKKNQTIFIEISNNPTEQSRQNHYNNYTHSNKGNNNYNLHKKTKNRSSFSEKSKNENKENTPEKISKKLNFTMKTINIQPKRFKSKSPKISDDKKIGFNFHLNENKKESYKKNEKKILMSTLPRALIDISNDNKISQGLNITYNNDEVINILLKLKNKNTIISDDMKKELVNLRNNIDLLIDKYYN